MDYIAYDPKTGYVWVPAINIGSVDVVDTSNGSVREISGFATKELELKGRKRAQGPSGGEANRRSARAAMAGANHLSA